LNNTETSVKPCDWPFNYYYIYLV